MARKEGTLRKRGDGKWLLEVFLRTEIAEVKYRGEVRTKPVNRTYSEVYRGEREECARKRHTGAGCCARARLRELLDMRNRGELGKAPEPAPVEAPAETLAEYVDRWLDLIRPTIRENTAATYANILARVKRAPIGAKNLPDVTTDDVETFYASLPARQVRETHVQLGGAMKRAAKQKIIPTNPCADAGNVPPKADANPVALTLEESAKVLAEIRGSEHELPIALMLGTGVRICEFLGVRWADLNGSNLEIRRSLIWVGGRFIEYPPKTKKSRRTVVVPASVLAMIEKHRKAQNEAKMRRRPDWQEMDFIFCNEVGLPLHGRPTNEAFKRAVSLAGVKTGGRHLTLYKCRHTRASVALANRANPRDVSDGMGHSTVAFTLQTYGASMPGAQERAAEQLEDLFFGKAQAK